MKTFYALLFLLVLGGLLRFSATLPLAHWYSRTDALGSTAMTLSMRKPSKSLAPNLAALSRKPDLIVGRQATSDAVTSPQDFVYKGHKWPGPSPVVKFKININTTQ